MTKKQYNIIWGDDQINEILTDDLREYLTDLGITVKMTFTNAEDLGEFLKMHPEEIDAVITDANYSRDRYNKVDPDPYSELITGGLQYVMTLREMYPHKPFFICTQRKLEKLHERFNDGELNPFEGKIFDKTMEDFEIFFPEVVKEIEYRQTPEFIIRNRYHKELEIADRIDYEYEVNGRTYKSNAGKDIFKWLVDDYKGTLCNTHLYFNPIRKILEELQRHLASRDIIPSYISLTDFANFCKHNQGELITQTDYVEINGRRVRIQRYYALTKNLKSWAHPTLMRIFSYLLDTSQDGSHRSPSLSYKFDEYNTAHKGRCHVFRSVLYSMLEILNWCNEIITSTTFKNHWWGDLYGKTVRIQEESGNWYAGKIMLKPADAECMSDKTNPITIGVVTENDDSTTKDKYPLFYPIPGIIGMVRKDSKGVLYVYDSHIIQTNILEGDEVKILSLTPEHRRNATYKRIATVEKVIKTVNATTDNATSCDNVDNENANILLETKPGEPNTINNEAGCPSQQCGKVDNGIKEGMYSTDSICVGAVEYDNGVYHIGQDMWFHNKKGLKVGDEVEILTKMNNASPLPERMKYKYFVKVRKIQNNDETAE